MGNFFFSSTLDYFHSKNTFTAFQQRNGCALRTKNNYKSNVDKQLEMVTNLFNECQTYDEHINTLNSEQNHYGFGFEDTDYLSVSNISNLNYEQNHHHYSPHNYPGLLWAADVSSRDNFNDNQRLLSSNHSAASSSLTPDEDDENKVLVELEFDNENDDNDDDDDLAEPQLYQHYLACSDKINDIKPKQHSQNMLYWTPLNDLSSNSDCEPDSENELENCNDEEDHFNDSCISINLNANTIADIDVEDLVNNDHKIQSCCTDKYHCCNSDNHHRTFRPTHCPNGCSNDNSSTRCNRPLKGKTIPNPNHKKKSSKILNEPCFTLSNQLKTLLHNSNRFKSHYFYY